MAADSKVGWKNETVSNSWYHIIIPFHITSRAALDVENDTVGF